MYCRRRLGDLSQKANRAVCGKRYLTYGHCRYNGAKTQLCYHVLNTLFGFLWLLLTLDSETQLKRRFQLWGVKKYIPHQDMTVILWLKMQHDAAGEQVRIWYKGHEVDQDRIERALKRRKGPLNRPRCKTPNDQVSLN